MTRLFEHLRSTCVALGLAMAWAALMPPAAHPEPAAASLSVQRAWARATPPGISVGVAFFEVRNAGPADVLLRIETPLTKQVEMHATRVVDGVAEMRQAASVAIPAHGRVEFRPGALHAMLLGLEKPLRAGDSFELTLVFRSAGCVAVRVPVLDIGASAPPGPDAAPATVPAPATRSAPAAGSPFRLAEWPANLATPSFALQDTSARARTAADYRGRILVVFFGFTHCPDVCPAVLFKLAQVRKQLDADAGQVQVLFVTLDPERDAPAPLARYAQAFDPTFIALTGSAAAVDAAAASFHVEYAKVATANGYTLDHSTAVFILDQTGKLRLVGSTSSQTADFVHDLKLLAGR